MNPTTSISQPASRFAAALRWASAGVRLRPLDLAGRHPPCRVRGRAVEHRRSARDPRFHGSGGRALRDQHPACRGTRRTDDPSAAVVERRDTHCRTGPRPDRSPPRRIPGTPAWSRWARSITGPPRSSETFSSRGPTLDGRVKPDLVAGDCAPTVILAVFCGTSEAAPFVSGAAALILEAHPELGPTQLATYLRIACDADRIAGPEQRNRLWPAGAGAAARWRSNVALRSWRRPPRARRARRSSASPPSGSLTPPAARDDGGRDRSCRSR